MNKKTNCMSDCTVVYEIGSAWASMGMFRRHLNFTRTTCVLKGNQTFEHFDLPFQPKLFFGYPCIWYFVPLHISEMFVTHPAAVPWAPMYCSCTSPSSGWVDISSDTLGIARTTKVLSLGYSYASNCCTKADEMWSAVHRHDAKVNGPESWIKAFRKSSRNLSWALS